jgi:hypothetical protein
MVGPLVPFSGLAGNIATATDPYLRETRRFNDSSAVGPIVEKVAARVPGLSQALPKRLDVMGEPVERGNTGWAAFLPAGSKENSDTVREELKRVEVAPDFMDKSLRFEDEKIDLTRNQWLELQAKAGKATYAAVKGLIRSEAYGNWDQETRQKELKATIRRAREEVRENFKTKLKDSGGR